MKRGTRYFGPWLAAAALWLLALVPARAVLVDLDLYVTFSILNNGGAGNLADGSWIMVVGSGDSVNGGMQTYGGATNYIANSTVGDDILLGYAYIGQNSLANDGKFFRTFQYDSDQVGSVYIRYFQSTGPGFPTGMVYWGQSGVSNLVPTNFGVVSIDLAPDSSLIASNFNNFVVIPEPDTAHLMFITGGLLIAFRMSQRQQQRKKRNQAPRPPL